VRSAYHESYGSKETQISEVIAWSAKLALENISNSDALYHNVDHTTMVTSAGQSIIKGKHLCEGGVSPRDWLHFMLALLFIFTKLLIITYCPFHSFFFFLV